MTKDEALKLALEALEKYARDFGSSDLTVKAMYVVRQALAQPEQEPVAFASHGVVNWIADKQFQHEALLYSAPQRTWVGLTYEEQRELYKKHDMDGWGHFYNAIEAKLKEKNT
jgi:hypothetical protein